MSKYFLNSYENYLLNLFLQLDRKYIDQLEKNELNFRKKVYLINY